MDFVHYLVPFGCLGFGEVLHCPKATGCRVDLCTRGPVFRCTGRPGDLCSADRTFEDGFGCFGSGVPEKARGRRLSRSNWRTGRDRGTECLDRCRTG